MMVKEDSCHECGQKLRARESSDKILLLCINERCGNYWLNRGCEIIMVLK